MAPKPYIIKQANMYILHNADGVRIGHIYLAHGMTKYREEFNQLIEDAFELREE